MKKCLKNFKDLFSLDKETIYKALLEKKNLINGIFYADYSFCFHKENDKLIYDDLFSLLNNSLYLKNDKSEVFSYRYFEKNISYVKSEGHFVVKFDFTNLSEKVYKELFANFFQCISKEEITFFDNEIMDELIKIMISSSDFVLILEKANLLNGCYYLPNIVKEIIYDKEFIDEEKEETLKEIASSLDIKLREINNG